MKTGGDSDEDSLFDEDDDSEDEESDEGTESTICRFYYAENINYLTTIVISFSHSDADGRPELKGRAKWLKKAVTAKDPLEDAAKKEEKKRRTDKSDKKRYPSTSILTSFLSHHHAPGI